MPAPPATTTAPHQNGPEVSVTSPSAAAQPMQFVAGHPISPATLANLAAAQQQQQQQMKAAVDAAAAAAGGVTAVSADQPMEDTTAQVKLESGPEVPMALSPTRHVATEAPVAMDTKTEFVVTSSPASPPPIAMPMAVVAIPITMAAAVATTTARPHQDSEEDSDDEEEGATTAHRPATSAAGRSRKTKNVRVSCHQCKTTKEDGLLLFCTTKAEKGLRKRKCRKKYCDACLRRSYNMSIAALTPSEIATYCCPACHGTCSCAACQRKQLESMARRGDPTMMKGGGVSIAQQQLQQQHQQQLQQLHQLQPTQATAVMGHGLVHGGVGMGYTMYTTTAIPTAATQVSSAVAVAGVPLVGSKQPLTAAAMQAQLQATMHAQMIAAGTAAAATPGRGPMAHVATAVIPAMSVAINTSPLSGGAAGGVTSPTSQPMMSPSASSVSTSGLTLSLAQLHTQTPPSTQLTNDALYTVAASTTPPSSSSSSAGAAVVGSQSQLPSAATGERDPIILSLAQQHQRAAAAAATTQAEIEEKTRQLQDLLARRMAQDPNFLANLGPGNPLQIIRNIMQAGGGAAGFGGTGASSNAAMEEDDPMRENILVATHSGVRSQQAPAEEWEEHARDQHAYQQHQRRLKYEKQTALQAQMTQHLLPADAPIHAALSMPTKSRTLSASSKRAAAAAAAQASGDPSSALMTIPPKVRGASHGKSVRTGHPNSNPAGAAGGLPRIYKRKGTPPSPYQRLDGEAAEKERARRMSPVTQYEYGVQPSSAGAMVHSPLLMSRSANSAPSSQRTSPSMRPRTAATPAPHLGMLSPRQLAAMHLQQQQQHEEDMSLMHDDDSPSNRSAGAASLMSPSDPNYHRWLAKRQAEAGAAGEEAQLHYSNSYNQRLLQAHKLMMEQSQRARGGELTPRGGPEYPHHREHSAGGMYEFSQSVPPPTMTVDVGARYANHTSSASATAVNYPQTPSQLGGALFSPMPNTYSPRQHQPQHHQQHMNNGLFSPLPSSSTPTHGHAHSSSTGLSIGLHHPSHSYLMGSPMANGGTSSSMDGGSQSQMLHEYGANGGFSLPTPMQTSRGVSSIQPGSGSPTVAHHGGGSGSHGGSFLFTPLAPQTPSMFMSLSSHATSGTGIVHSAMQGGDTPLPLGASTNAANYATHFDWGQTVSQTRTSPRPIQQQQQQPSPQASSLSTPAPTGVTSPPSISNLRLSLTPVGSPTSGGAPTMSPHVRGSDILGMLSPGGANHHQLTNPSGTVGGAGGGLSSLQMPISPMMSPTSDGNIPMLPTMST